MSSEFATELECQPWARACVLLTAMLMALTGVTFTITMPVAIWLRAALAALWFCYCWREFGRQLGGYARLNRLCLSAAGEAWAIGPSGVLHSLELASGSMVLSRVAWLRLRFADGSHYGELLTGHPLHCERWHGLQLIWEQRRDAFGRTRRS